MSVQISAYIEDDTKEKMERYAIEVSENSF